MPRVVYIAGSTRSGSTVLELELSRLVGAVAVGELRYVWDRGFANDELCSCGVAFGSCPFWRVLAEQVSGRVENVRKHLGPLLRTRRLPLYAVPAMLHRSTAYRTVEPAIQRLYQAISQSTGDRLIVDSSKDPMYLRLLRAAGVEVFVIHLTRDSRGVAYSWSRRRHRPEVVGATEYMPILRPAAVAREWDRVNVLTEIARSPNYVRVRYEDFVEAPVDSLQPVLSGLQELDWISPVKGNRVVRHSVAGNPVRFSRDGVLVKDEEWTIQMSPGRKALVTSLTAPLLVRYGYSLR